MLKTRPGIIAALLVAPLLGALAFSSATKGAEFSTTELQWQYGRLKVPKFAGGGEDNTNILTVQHASGYKWGDFYGFTTRHGPISACRKMPHIADPLSAAAASSRATSWADFTINTVGF
jgi:hypothetical protein